MNNSMYVLVLYIISFERVIITSLPDCLNLLILDGSTLVDHFYHLFLFCTYYGCENICLLHYYNYYDQQFLILNIESLI